MTKKIITWVDLQGRYRVTSPTYNDGTRPAGETEDECLERVWAAIVAKGGYGIPIDHPHFYVEDADQRTKLAECCGNEFRYAGKPDANGETLAVDGAWEMDTDGTPKVNMTKARVVHMDKIRVVRNAELVKKDVPFMRAVEAGDTDAQATIGTAKQVLRDLPATFNITTGVDTPEKLLAKWPTELPARE
jgi:uncharacterized Zn-finger protein